MQTLPFLYLPDALTLVLLMLVLGELRKIAISHVRQELLITRKEMLAFWLDNDLDRADAGYVALRGLIDSCIRIAPKISPARLFFIHRLQKRMTSPLRVPNPASVAALRIGCIRNKSGREKLRRLQLEMNLALGTFFVMGSISGWAVLFLLVPRMIGRSFTRHSGHKIDAFFDMAERLLSRLGRRAQEIGLAS